MFQLVAIDLFFMNFIHDLSSNMKLMFLHVW
jgi:hypothetical protein